MKSEILQIVYSLKSYFCVAALIGIATPVSAIAQGTKADYERANNLGRTTAGKVYNARINPTWIQGSSNFWYRRETGPGKNEYRLVIPKEAANAAAFNHEQLAKALSAKSNRNVQASALPIRDLIFSEDIEKCFFMAYGNKWSFIRDDPETLSTMNDSPKNVETRNPFPKVSSYARRSDKSPDGLWQVISKDFNLVLEDRKSQESHPLTIDGNEQDRYDSRVYWSPDGKKFIALKIKPSGKRTIHFVESSPKDQLQPKLHSRFYLKPGDDIELKRPRLFDVESKSQIDVDESLFNNPWAVKEFRWKKNSSEFTFYYNQRGHQVVRVIGINSETGRVRTIINEESSTFVDYAYKHFAHYLDDTHEIIWMSERDGWNHLYLIDEATGKVKNQITKGEWIVRGIDWIDEENRQIWLRISGIDPRQDPYYIHHIRINFDGSHLIRLTEGDGTHSVRFSGDRVYLIDTWSRVDLPPVSVVRRSSDGKKICDVEAADWDSLIETGWKIPERFVAKGRDGVTEIYGLIYRPSNFDPEKKYPVIEDIYAGPHDSFVPKAFHTTSRAQALAEIGFIVVRCDGMGTSNRSKAFHNVAWKNIGDSGFPDRIAWIKAAGAKYPQLDLLRVGIFGGSAGGQSTVRALIAHNDFYHVGVADCGCHDNRMDKIWWNELWMGWPIGPHYKEQSNVTQAHQLKGKLFLTVGEMDTNVDPASTMQVVNALIKADKDFDMLIVPGAGHGVGESQYVKRRRRDFFVRYLLGVEPRS